MIAVSDSNGALEAPAIVADSFGSPATIGRLFLTDHLLGLRGDLADPARRRDRRRRARRRRPAAGPPSARRAGEREPSGERYDLRRELPRRERRGRARERGGRVTPGIGSWIMLSSALFCIGLVGVMLRRNPLVILLSLEIMLNAGNLLLVAGSRYVGGNDGQVLALDGHGRRRRRGRRRPRPDRRARAPRLAARRRRAAEPARMNAADLRLARAAHAARSASRFNIARRRRASRGALVALGRIALDPRRLRRSRCSPVIDLLDARRLAARDRLDRLALALGRRLPGRRRASSSTRSRP